MPFKRPWLGAALGVSVQLLIWVIMNSQIYQAGGPQTHLMTDHPKDVVGH